MSDAEFVRWLDEELARRNWRQADLARAAGISTGSLSQVYNGGRRVGPDIANAIAAAFEIPSERVFRIVGLLPESPGPERDPTFTEILEIMRNLPPEERREILDYALFRFRRHQDDA